MNIMRALGLVATILSGTTTGVLAAPTGYTDQAAFDVATVAMSNRQTVDFDGVTAGTLIASGTGIGGLTFGYVIPGFSMQVSDTFGTTSGSNYLGLNNPDTAFYLGDSFTIDFHRTVHAVGLYLITGSDAQPGDLELSVGGTSIFNDGLFVPVSDGKAYYLGLVETDASLGFTTATVHGVDSGAFVAFSADDITTAAIGVPAIPEPGSWALMLVGLGAIAGIARRTRR